MYNHVFVLQHIDSADFPRPLRPMKEPVPSNPCLPLSLPSTGFLQREADTIAPKSIIKQLRRSPSPPSIDELQEALSSPLIESTASPTISSPTLSERLFPQHAAGKAKAQAPRGRWKEPEPYEVLRAVERRDVMYLMEVRDRAFHLLVRQSGGVTPLLHAMRIGKSHSDVAVILLGAFSRYVNHLEDEEMTRPQTKRILKALRANLKLAIDYGLQSSQSDLIASFLQTLVMSEGDKWVSAQVSNISLALRAGTEGKPVYTAQTAVRKFATKELGKAQAIAALDD
ncbi:hypothetical protein EVG20_g247 [Dentipellis fragilis]|uniref:Uncharacterized protein n=1 Tax=Dentipellis fragilis TaxID=205917 RepID=A0A4Y9ZGZ1_9AGAM|nr:hypothetical protein EVG20_g247 [Dentipellis fragilis]